MVEVIDERPDRLGELLLNGVVALAKICPTRANSSEVNPRVRQRKTHRTMFPAVSLAGDYPPGLMNAGVINKDFYDHCAVRWRFRRSVQPRR